MQIAPVYVQPVNRQNQNIKKMIEEEWKSLGEPRVTPDLLLDLQALAVQKQIIVNKNRLEGHEL